MTRGEQGSFSCWDSQVSTSHRHRVHSNTEHSPNGKWLSCILSPITNHFFHMLSLPWGSDLAWKISTRSQLFFFLFSFNIWGITLNHVKLEKQFKSDCSQGIFKNCSTLQTNVLENTSLPKKLFWRLIWGRKVFEGMKNCFNCIT